MTNYFMDSPSELHRLEIKTDFEKVRDQALWAGLVSGMRVLDAGCGPGITSALLSEFIIPGQIIGLDSSSERIQYARQKFGKPGIDFHVHDLTKPLAPFGKFDLIWIRFVLEYYANNACTILKNLYEALEPQGILCLVDLDYNCLSHFGLSQKLQKIIPKLVWTFEQQFNFDPYAGRKLYSYLVDLDLQDIDVTVKTHHLLYGPLSAEQRFNWTSKAQRAVSSIPGAFWNYEGGTEQFLSDINDFFDNPRRFTYTPLVMCKGTKRK